MTVAWGARSSDDTPSGPDPGAFCGWRWKHRRRRRQRGRLAGRWRRCWPRRCRCTPSGRTGRQSSCLKERFELTRTEKTWSGDLVYWPEWHPIPLVWQQISFHCSESTYINPPGEKSSRWGELKAAEVEPFVLEELLFFSSEIQWESHQSERFLEAETAGKVFIYLLRWMKYSEDWRQIYSRKLLEAERSLPVTSCLCLIADCLDQLRPLRWTVDVNTKECPEYDWLH